MALLEIMDYTPGSGTLCPVHCAHFRYHLECKQAKGSKSYKKKIYSTPASRVQRSRCMESNCLSKHVIITFTIEIMPFYCGRDLVD